MKLELPQILTHIAGFLITFWILKRYAFKPLLKMMEDRRERIRTDLDQAAQTRATTQKLEAEYVERIKNIETEARQKIQEAVSAGRRVAAEIKEQAHTDARGIIEKAKADLVRDIATARVQLKEDIVAMTLATTQKLLRESLDEERQRKLISEFIDQVETAQ